MTTRTLRLVALALAVALVWDWSPAVPPFPEVASAQAQIPIAAPNGTIVYSQASFTTAQATTPIKVFKYIVPAGFIATSTAVPSTGFGTEIYTESRTNVPIAVARQPLKLTMLGNLRTAQGQGAPGTFDLGVSFGGTAATMALANAAILPPSCVNQPITVEVWISPIATSTATPTSGNSSVYVAGRVTLPGVALAGSACLGGLTATAGTVNNAVLGTTNLSSPTLLNVEWKWSSASATNVVDWFHRSLKIGD